MSTSEIPQGAYSPEVYISELDAEAQYQRYIASLNTNSPDTLKARSQLGALQWVNIPGYPEEVCWNRILAIGEAEDIHHEVRALIAIAKGDPRPMGNIYDEIRRRVKPTIDKYDLDKARRVADTYNPLVTRPHSFF
jgi:hypothetical protein